MAELQYGKIPELEKKLAAAQAAEQKPTQLVRNSVTEEEIAEVVSKWTGIPVSKMLEGEKDKLLRMEEALGKRVVGQDEALKIVANAIRRSRAGLADPRRPNGSFLFLGPTGVGKTETCKALAEFLFDTEDAIVRVDMSEFMEQHSVARLIGAPPGYVGYEEGGYLTEAVRRKPYSVVLLDEVEKAHKDVFNVLLQVLDDGRLTDGQGRTVDFRNTVIIMTSNLGSDVIQQLAGEKQYARMKTEVMERVQEHFRPEFINRIDDIVVFHPLGEEQIRAIVDIQLAGLKSRLAERDMSLDLSEAARDQLGEAGFDPVYGARPLKRAHPAADREPAGRAHPAGPVRARRPHPRRRGRRGTALREARTQVARAAHVYSRFHAVLRIPVPQLRPRARGPAEGQRSRPEKVPGLREKPAEEAGVRARVPSQGWWLVRDRLQVRQGQQAQSGGNGEGACGGQG